MMIRRSNNCKRAKELMLMEMGKYTHVKRGYNNRIRHKKAARECPKGAGKCMNLM